MPSVMLRLDAIGRNFRRPQAGLGKYKTPSPFPVERRSISRFCIDLPELDPVHAQFVKFAKDLAQKIFGERVRVMAVPADNSTAFAGYIEGVDAFILRPRIFELPKPQQMVLLFHEFRHRAVMKCKVKPIDASTLSRCGLLGEQYIRKISEAVATAYFPEEHVTEIDAQSIGQICGLLYDSKPDIGLIREIVFLDGRQEGSPTWQALFNASSSCPAKIRSADTPDQFFPSFCQIK